MTATAPWGALHAACATAAGVRVAALFSQRGFHPKDPRCVERAPHAVRLHAACAQVHAVPVLLHGAEVVLGRTVARDGGVCVPLAQVRPPSALLRRPSRAHAADGTLQVSSNHCRFLPGGQGPDAPLAWVCFLRAALPLASG
jgi:hypothetical protein